MTQRKKIKRKQLDKETFDELGEVMGSWRSLLQAKKDFNKKRKAFVETMKEKNIETIDTRTHSVNLKYFRQFDYDKLKTEYPEIYYSAVEEKVNPKLAYDEFGKELVETVFDNCTEGGYHGLQIQAKKRRSSKGKSRGPDNSAEKG